MAPNAEGPYPDPKTTTRTIIQPLSPPTIKDFELKPKPPTLHDGTKTDLDPTEWKPDSDKQFRRSSTAFTYLSQFHRSVSGQALDPRSGLQGRASAPAVPTLHTTPALRPTVAVSTSTASSGGGESNLVTPENRGLTPRLHIYSASTSNLVQPMTISSTSVIGAIDLSGKEQTDDRQIDITYEKKVIPRALSDLEGSLSKLLAVNTAEL